MGFGGRPKKIINAKQLEGVCRLMATLQEAADHFEVSKKTIERFIRDEFDLSFGVFRTRCMTGVKFSLRQQALERRNKSDDMLKFCLKNIDGWRERTESQNTNTNNNINLNYKLEEELEEIDSDAESE